MTPRHGAWAARRLPAPCAIASWLLLALAAVVMSAPAQAATARRSHHRHDVLLANADTLYRSGRTAAANAFLDSLVAAARSAGDTRLDAAATIRRGMSSMYFNRFDDADRDGLRARAQARTLRDTLLECRALLLRARTALFRERNAEARPVYRELLGLSSRLGDAGLEGNARLGLAYLDLDAGRRARSRAGYARAVALLHASGDLGGEMAARVGLARAVNAMGRSSEARDLYLALIARCREVGDKRDEAAAWNNLGAIEIALGRPERASSYYAHALELNRALGRPTTTQAVNMAHALLLLGLRTQARDALERELNSPGAGASTALGYTLRTALARTYASFGRMSESERMLSALWAIRDSVPKDLQLSAATALGMTWRASGHPEKQAALLATALGEAGTAVPELDRLGAEAQLAEAEQLSGAGDAALPRARRIWRTTAGNASLWLPNFVSGGVLAHGMLAAGERDSALRMLTQLSRDFDFRRASMQEAEINSIAVLDGRLVELTAAVHLDPTLPGPSERHAEDAFDALQYVRGTAGRARAGGAGPAGAPVTARRFARDVLRPGECFLDVYYSSADSSMVLLLLSPGQPVRSHRVENVTDDFMAVFARTFLAQRPDASMATESPAKLRRLFGPLLPAIAASRRIWYCPTSGLTALPLGAMIDRFDPAQPHELALVPSATWLAKVRATPEPNLTPASLTLLARTTNDSGQPLAGVTDETDWLSRRYRTVGVRHAGERSLDELLPWLGRGSALHLSAHSRWRNDDPWDSGLLLGHGSEESEWLSSRLVSAGGRSPQLVTLATCSSSGGSNYSNQGVLGLSSAFLSVGARTVLSAQWEVDDRVTSRLVKTFYDALDRHRTAGEALAEAKRAIATDPATASPWYWAGFVISGDPGLRVTLPRRGR